MQQYFHPSMEDVFPGYVCQRQIMDFSKEICCSKEAYAQYCLDDTFEWENYVLTKEDCIALLQFDGDLRNGEGIPVVGFFRTPYLTKEQIESEGWKPLDELSPFTGKPCKWRKEYEFGFNHWNIFTLEFHGTNFNPAIQIHYKTETSWQNENKYIYSGQCKDINTLRKIEKLLNIK